jgi:phytanoyl-CoA hydroxylase
VSYARHTGPRRCEIASAALTRDYETLSKAYGEDGMVTLGQILNADELRDVRAHVERYMQRVVPRMPPSVSAKLVRFESDGTSVRSCYAMEVVDDFFASLANRGVFRNIVRQVAGWEPEVYSVETFNKPGRVGSRVPMHQEVAFHLPDMSERAHLWLALDEVSAENGPVRFWLGSQLHGLLPHEPDGDGYLTCDENAATVRARKICTSIVPAGWATLHDGLIAHDSLPNRSAQARRGLLLGYVRAP